MKLFGKIISGKIKAELLGRFGMVVVTGLSVLLVGIFSFAWFSRNTTSGGSGMQLAVHTEGYDILIERTNTYESAVNYPIIVDSGRTKDKLASAGYDFTETSTSVAPKLAYELVNEDEVDSKFNLMPGSYGTLTFYLRPASEESLNLTFKIELGAYAIVYDDLGGEDFAEVTDNTVLNLLKGHLLFFTSRDRKGTDDKGNNLYQYDGFVSNETLWSFSYNTDEKSKCQKEGKTDCYEITLYWEWPLTYSDIFYTFEYNEEVCRKYPNEARSFAASSSNFAYFFIAGGENADDDEKELLYNDADQLIGTSANALVVNITVV